MFLYTILPHRERQSASLRTKQTNEEVNFYYICTMTKKLFALFFLKTSQSQGKASGEFIWHIDLANLYLDNWQKTEIIGSLDYLLCLIDKHSIIESLQKDYYKTPTGEDWLFYHHVNSVLKSEKQNQQTKKKVKTYLMKDCQNNLYKIGKSINPERRERTLQSEKPNIKLVKVWDNDIEKKLHKIYDKQRVRGEWFNLNQVQVRYICTHY